MSAQPDIGCKSKHPENDNTRMPELMVLRKESCDRIPNIIKSFYTGINYFFSSTLILTKVSTDLRMQIQRFNVNGL